jgi:hypothetical protein
MLVRERFISRTLKTEGCATRHPGVLQRIEGRPPAGMPKYDTVY